MASWHNLPRHHSPYSASNKQKINWTIGSISMIHLKIGYFTAVWNNNRLALYFLNSLSSVTGISGFCHWVRKSWCMPRLYLHVIIKEKLWFYRHFSYLEKQWSSSYSNRLPWVWKPWDRLKKIHDWVIGDQDNSFFRMSKYELTRLKTLFWVYEKRYYLGPL